MKPPSLSDKMVKVRAYLTDEAFGYEHWRAAQFSSPDGARPAILMLYDTDAERDAALDTLKFGRRHGDRRKGSGRRSSDQ